jgi:enediyne biosynthesis protein E4
VNRAGKWEMTAENAKARKRESAKGTGKDQHGDTETRRTTIGEERAFLRVCQSLHSMSPCLRVDLFLSLSRLRPEGSLWDISRSLVLGLSLLIAAGCRSERTAAPAATPAVSRSPAGSPVRFVDVAEQLGVRFKHTNGAAKGYFLAETMGSGCALLDYDGDGRLDLFLVNSTCLPGFPEKGPFYSALYHQRPDGTFEDVTRQAGLTVDCYGHGVAVGDYDNDGDPDLYLTAYGSNHLFRNSGSGTFTEVTRAAKVPGPAYGTSAAWFDYDRDGHLDLFVCNYCRWTTELNQKCGDSSGRYICGPKYYGGTTSVLYRNNGNGTFTDVTRRAKVDAPNGKALGVAVWDYNGDGWLDFAVANDTTPNWLFRNNRDGTFTEVSVEAGMAYAVNGQARAGMGIDTADYDNSGREALLVGNNSSEGLGLYRPESSPDQPGGGHFMDAAEEIGIFQDSLPFSTFGAMFVDVDLDGYADVLTANGHVNQQVARMAKWLGFEQRMQLFLNESGEQPGERRFRDVEEAAGEGISKPRVARGLATGDVDNDGDPDLLVCVNNGRAALLRNEGATGNHWLAIRPRGTKSNRDGLGTRVVLQVGERRQTGWVRSGSSYCSDNEHVARFGLGAATTADTVELHWPSGIQQTLRNVKADQVLAVTEPAQ